MRSENMKESGIFRCSAQEARLAAPEAPVLLRGNITQHVGRDLYVFEDATSSILVSIPSANWRNLEVTSGDFVELRGRLVRSRSYVKIAVARIARLR